MITLRSHQQALLSNPTGKVGILAVPGSGKTWTLSLLASEIIARGQLGEGQEVLVVTLVNSAVEIFNRRVSAMLEARGLPPLEGFRVRTLHGLAHDIVRERPGLVGLAENFVIVDEREADGLRDDAARVWLEAEPEALDAYLNEDLDPDRREWVRREVLPELVQDIAASFIRTAKDLQLTPEQVKRALANSPTYLPLAEMGADIYAAYQQALAYRGGVDFDDLIRLALQALQTDRHYLVRLRQRWPYILEDEAQDSSRLQEEILRLLSGTVGNWTRVGDPNQAIYATFTTASPRSLREFVTWPGVRSLELPVSGRSTQAVMDLANALVRWTQTEHPLEEVRDALSGPPYMEPTPTGDPQPNPPDEAGQIVLSPRKFSPVEEIQATINSLEDWLPQHPEATVAVLTPTNLRGFEVVNELRRRKIPYEDSLLRSSSSTRFSAGALGNLLRYLAEPHSASRLEIAYRVWRRADRDDPEAMLIVERAADLLRRLPRVEDYIWPAPEHDWLDAQELAGDTPQVVESLAEFREWVRRWLKAVQLPVDQLVLALAQDLLVEPAELAIAHKLAVLLRRAAQANPSWRLAELSEELGVIARNERRFMGISDDETGFDPDQHPGKVVVATMHKAKGLEWDRVYLLSVNAYNFPLGSPGERYVSEKWFLRDGLNLEAEILAQLRSAVSDTEPDYVQGEATRKARLEYARERLRLLYVGITRARRDLIVTWNSGRKGDVPPARPLVALMEYLQSRQVDIQP